MRALAMACLLGTAAFLGACASQDAPPPAAESPRATLQIVDLTAEVARFYDAHSELEGEVRASAFRTWIADKLPGFYDPARVRAPVDAYDRRLAAGFARFPEERAGIADVSRRFAAMLAPAQRSFEAAFGPMTGYPPIYLVHSFGEFDGGTRSLPEGGRLMFGADMIARLHGEHSIQPFFHHELFHLYHLRTFSDCDAIWCGLWQEGLATYVAQQLNPEATDAELLLTFPVPLRDAVERNRPEAICAVRQRLDSTERSDLNALFSSGRLSETLPPRFGYYVGLMVAAELGKTRSLQQLAALPPAEVRPLIERTLSSLANCPL